MFVYLEEALPQFRIQPLRFRTHVVAKQQFHPHKRSAYGAVPCSLMMVSRHCRDSAIMNYL